MSARDVLSDVFSGRDLDMIPSWTLADQALSALHTAGYVVAELPGEAPRGVDGNAAPLTCGFNNGWNACLAAIKANGGKDER